MTQPVNWYERSLDSRELKGNSETVLSDSDLNHQVSEILKNLPERYKRIHQGKVRDTYEHPDIPDQLIIIATDRVSTHDVVHKNTVPGKGEILTQISNFWFQYFSEHSDTKHIKTQKVKDFEFPRDFPDYLKKRAIIVQKLKPLPTEAIVRWYHYGSATKWYDSETGKLSTGIFVGTGLEKCSPYEEAIFTPSTKGMVDININFEWMITHIDTWLQENNISW
jgi:phosphoribosylaminoimidazole-succinocarboxamide synthase